VDAPVCQPRLAYFDFDEAAIRSDAKSTLEENANCLKSRKDVRAVQVVGHCDERGTEEYNMALGKRRADAAKGVLTSRGLDNVSAKSRGDLDPVVPGASSESDHQRNRRAECVVNP
jgi:peptidoglycan-associated lipoprotein